MNVYYVMEDVLKYVLTHWEVINVPAIVDSY